MILQMAARDTGVGAVETLLHQGKLLALDLLVKVFENPLHTWQNVRPQVCRSPSALSAFQTWETQIASSKTLIPLRGDPDALLEELSFQVICN